MFVGRAEELASAAEMLFRGQRLITVTGGGGLGKTRFARELLRAHGSRFAGVAFCDCTDAHTVLDLFAAIGAALRVPLPPGGNEESIATHIAGVLRERPTPFLLVLDNLEQLLPHAQSSVRRFLEGSRVSFLVTSRAWLEIEGEHVLELSPLSLGAWNECESAELLAARIDRDVAPEEHDALRELIELLDGIPLAIELAAGRLLTLDARSLAQRIRSDPRVLKNRAKSPDRHRTLETTVDWSWRLLSPAEQSALAQASVFVAGFTVEAAEEVVAIAPSTQGEEVLDVLESLRRKSMFRTETTAVGVRLYEPVAIRELAAQRLDPHDDAAGRHRRYFARVAVEKFEAAQRIDDPTAAKWLELERGNIEAIVARASTHAAPDFERVIPLVRMLRWLVHRVGSHARLIGWVDGLLERATERLVRAELFYLRADMKRHLNRYDESERDLAEAQSLLRDDDPAVLRLKIAYLQTVLLTTRSDLRAAERTALREIERTRASDRETRIQLAFNRIELGDLMRELGDFEGALSHLESGLAVTAEERVGREQINALWNIARVRIDLGQFAEARRALDRADALQFSEPAVEALLVIERGLLELFSGNLDRAAELFARGETRALASGMLRRAAMGKMFLGVVDLMKGAISSARARFDAVRPRHRSGSDLELWARGLYAVALAEEGAIDEASAMLAALTKDAPAVAGIHQMHVSLARARAAFSRGEIGAVLELRAEIDARIAEEREAQRGGATQERRVALLVLVASLERSPDARADVVIDASGATFTSHGETIDIAHRTPLRLLLAELARAHVASPERPLAADALICAGWPDERIDSRSAKSRLHVAISTLRKLGLGTALASNDLGYWLERSVVVRNR